MKKKKKKGMKRRKQVTCELHSDAAKTWYQKVPTCNFDSIHVVCHMVILLSKRLCS
jgi:hypothetical protein